VSASVERCVDRVNERRCEATSSTTAATVRRQLRPGREADVSIPLIDLAPWFSGSANDRRRVAVEVDRHLQDVGFLLVTGHGFDPAVFGEARDAARAFYALPTEVKQAYAYRGGPYRGWIGPGSESNAGAYGVDAPPDLKETFALGRPDVPEALRREVPRWFAPNVYPAEIPEFQPAVDRFVLAANALVRELLVLLAAALDTDPEAMVGSSRQSMSSASINWYQPLTALERPPEPGQFRIGPHTDYGTLTVLDRETGAGGLQVLVDGAWIDAPWVDGALTVNTGLLMQRWSNGRWTPNEHRVLPPPASHPDEELFSLVSFNSPDHDAVIEPLAACCSPDNPSRYEPVVAGEHLAALMTALAVDP
jgi:isopenicillin N synthase-like dioxygenase